MQLGELNDIKNLIPASFDKHAQLRSRLVLRPDVTFAVSQRDRAGSIRLDCDRSFLCAASRAADSDMERLRVLPLKFA